MSPRFCGRDDQCLVLPFDRPLAEPSAHNQRENALLRRELDALRGELDLAHRASAMSAITLLGSSRPLSVSTTSTLTCSARVVTAGR
jgi:hypothetical protein